MSIPVKTPMKTLLITLLRSPAKGGGRTSKGASLVFMPRENSHHSDDPLLRFFEVRTTIGEANGYVKHARDTLAQGANQNFERNLRDAGEILYKNLVPQGIKDELRGYRGPLLICSFNTNIPWELCHDGEEFWGLKYNIGRQAISSESAEGLEVPREPGQRLRTLVVGADPRNDLPCAATEARRVWDFFKFKGEPGGRLRATNATFSEVLSGLNGADLDIFHFIGHLDESDDGPELLIGDAGLSERFIKRNLRGHPLVYLSCCGSAAEGAVDDPQRSLGIVRAFLLARASGVVASIRTGVSDSQAPLFAESFYRHLVSEKASYGEALRRARIELRGEFPNSPIWASFVLYGLPTIALHAEPTWGHVTKVKALFDATGELSADAWTDEVRAILQGARGRAVAASSACVEPTHLTLALIESSWFKEVVSTRGSSAAPWPPVREIIAVVKAWANCAGVGTPLDTPPTRFHLADKVLEICESAARKANADPVGPAHVMAAVMEDEAIAGLLAQLWPGITDFLRTAKDSDARDEKTRALFADAAPSVPHGGAGPVAASLEPATRFPACDLFDALGHLNKQAVDATVFDALSTAAGAGAIEETASPARIFVCLATSREILNEKGVSALDHQIVAPLLRRALESVLGLSRPQGHLQRQPTRTSLSRESITLLNRLHDEGPNPISWKHLLAGLQELPDLEWTDCGTELDARIAALFLVYRNADRGQQVRHHHDE